MYAMYIIKQEEKRNFVFPTNAFFLYKYHLESFKLYAN